MTEHKRAGIVALMAQTQQILVQAQRYIEFSAVQVIASLPIGNLKELRGRTQLFPQHSRTGIGMAQFRRGRSLDTEQDRTEGSVKSEFLPPMFERRVPFGSSSPNRRNASGGSPPSSRKY